MKLQFGSGSNQLRGWRNHDAEVNICEALPYGDGVADFILCEHCVEHQNCAQGFHFMQECHRILKPGGTLRLCVPILDRIQDANHCRDLITGHGHQMLYCLSTMVTMLQLAGFETVHETGRKECDGHHRVIGIAKDDLESLRVEAVKAK